MSSVSASTGETRRLKQKRIFSDDGAVIVDEIDDQCKGRDSLLYTAKSASLIRLRQRPGVRKFLRTNANRRAAAASRQCGSWKTQTAPPQLPKRKLVKSSAGAGIQESPTAATCLYFANEAVSQAIAPPSHGRRHPAAYSPAHCWSRRHLAQAGPANSPSREAGVRSTHSPADPGPSPENPPPQSAAKLMTPRIPALREKPCKSSTGGPSSLPHLGDVEAQSPAVMIWWRKPALRPRSLVAPGCFCHPTEAARDLHDAWARSENPFP